MIKSFVLPVVLALMAAIPSLADTPGSWSFADDFSGGQGILNARTPSGAKVAWNASANLKLHETDGTGFVSPADERSFLARVVLPEFSSGTLSIEAKVRVTTPAKGSWVAIGFGNPQIRGKHTITWYEGIFLLVDSRGNYNCLINPGVPGEGSDSATIKITGGRVPGLASGVPVPLRLLYDTGKGTLTVTVNGKVVLEDYELANHNFEPKRVSAGFSGYNQIPEEGAVSALKIELNP